MARLALSVRVVAKPGAKSTAIVHEGASASAVPVADCPPPLFENWEDYLVRTPAEIIRAWCAKKASRANRKRLLSVAPSVKITAADVLNILMTAKGRCHYCNSLCVENRPSGPNGAPMRWTEVGRRVGSLGHVQSRFSGGDNELDNLTWECLWWNTWTSERIRGATDHGGIQ